MTMDPITAIALRAATAYANGEIDFEHYQRITALCTLWLQGVEKPSHEDIEYRIAELNTASAFLSGSSVSDENSPPAP